MDTSVWSLAIRRRRPPDDTTSELAALIREGRALMLGAVRQELLSGIKTEKQFDLLRDHLRAFPDLTLDAADYEAAAEAYNRCRAAGIQGSNTDFLICAVAQRRGVSIFSTDRDFEHFATVLDLNLHSLRTDTPAT